MTSWPREESDECRPGKDHEIFSDEPIPTCGIHAAAAILSPACPSVGRPLLLPVRVGDYTDFYSSIEHATNLGKMFRDPANALLPNWRHLPVGYHGRASSIVVSGTPFHRPKGQTKSDDQPAPVFGPTRMLDFELEVAFVTCGSTSSDKASPLRKRRIISSGFVLFNDMSARDVQKWEYVPLGPFLSKNFGSVSRPGSSPLRRWNPSARTARCRIRSRLPYLQFTATGISTSALEVSIQPDKDAGDDRQPHQFRLHVLEHLPATGPPDGERLQHQHRRPLCFRHHQRTGPDSYGSMLELTWQGTKPLTLDDGATRKFLEDGMTVTIRGFIVTKTSGSGSESVPHILPAE